MNIKMQSFPSQRQAELTVETVAQGAALPNTFPETLGVPSELPLGTGARWSKSNATIKILARTRWESVSLTLRGIGPKDPATPEMEQAAEAAARYCLSALAAKRTGTPSTSSRSGLSAQYAADQRTGHLLISLSDWAEGRGWNLNVNPLTARAYATKANRAILIPLGAMKFSTGGVWHDLPDIVRKVGSEYFVPFAALDTHR